MSAREEFVRLAVKPDANKSELCRRFGISRPTGDKWIARFEATGCAGLVDRSRRPHHSPNRLAAWIEAAIVRARKAQPAWGARTLKAWMLARGHRELPSEATFQAIFERNGLLDPAHSARHKPFVRFEQPAPNALWQMDFKGHFALANATRCHPLTVLDDHSRFSICLQACANEQVHTVRQALTESFQRYGLPDRMLMDNGSPWGDQLDSPHTLLTVWLMSLDVAISHSRPYHPQTLGKDERFHRTLKQELLSRELFSDLAQAQRRFNAWRDVYNLQRPHYALEHKAPITRYRPSTRSFSGQLAAFEYAPSDHVRRVQMHGRVSFRGLTFRVGKAFRGQQVALRQSAETDGIMQVYFRSQRIAELDLRVNHSDPCVNHVSEHL